MHLIESARRGNAVATGFKLSVQPQHATAAATRMAPTAGSPLLSRRSTRTVGDHNGDSVYRLQYLAQEVSRSVPLRARMRHHAKHG
jgi:hypothetical protein